jgi:AcrR family transcriptional regulator
MQRLHEKKRRLIVATAAKMFATRPYHKVRLDDIAAGARIGKGTVYLYFDNKEDLYFSLIYDGFEHLVDRLRGQMADAGGNGARVSAAQLLRRIVDELVGFAFAHPHFFELMRTSAAVPKELSTSAWSRKRQELQDLIVAIIQRGVAAGDLADPNPEMTAVCLGGMVRSIMLFGPKGAEQREVADQVYRIVERGIVCGKKR